MSTVAGGEIIIGPALIVGASVVAAGALVLGAGYLVCYGGYRAVRAGKEALDRQLEAMAEARRQRLAALRAADEAQMQRLQALMTGWALQGQEYLRQQEEKLRRQEQERLAELLALEQEAATTAAAQKQLELAEKEFQQLRGVTTGYMMADEDHRSQYQDRLAKECQRLKNYLAQRRRAFSVEEKIGELATVSLELPPDSGPGPDPAGATQRLAACHGQLACFRDLAAKERQSLETEMNALAAMVQVAPNSAETETRLAALENQLTQTQKELAQQTEKRQEVWEAFFALQDRYITLQGDALLKTLLAEPLANLGQVLAATKDKLNQPAPDYQACLAELKSVRQVFEGEQDERLRRHQHKINHKVKDQVRAVLQDLKYGQPAIEDHEGAILLKAAGPPEYPEAEVQVEISPEGIMNIDLSGKGFLNQKVCTQEFDRLREALLRRGVHVTLDKRRQTWLEHFLVEKLENLGYARENIVVENLSDDLFKVSAGPASQKSVTANRDSGKIIQQEGIINLSIKPGDRLHTQKEKEKERDVETV